MNHPQPISPSRIASLTAATDGQDAIRRLLVILHGYVTPPTRLVVERKLWQAVHDWYEQDEKDRPGFYVRFQRPDLPEGQFMFRGTRCVRGP
jgi:hypothetical protein